MSAEAPHLVAIDHEVVCGDKWLEHDHPTGVGGPLKQRVSQLGNVHVHLVGAVDQIWNKMSPWDSGSADQRICSNHSK